MPFVFDAGMPFLVLGYKHCGLGTMKSKQCSRSKSVSSDLLVPTAVPEAPQSALHCQDSHSFPWQKFH